MIQLNWIFFNKGGFFGSLGIKREYAGIEGIPRKECVSDILRSSPSSAYIT